MSIRTLVERIVFENRFVRVYNDDVEFPSGAKGSYLRVESPGAATGAVVLAVCDGKVALVQQYRYPLGASVWEFPRGNGLASPEATAVNELLEETGAVATSVSVMGHTTPDSGLLTSRVALVLVECATATQRLDGAEDTEALSAVRWVSVAEMTELIATGAIECAMTVTAFALAHAQRRL